MQGEYNKGCKITDAMPIYSVGIVTGKDEESISQNLLNAQKLARKHSISLEKVKPILYRPFDQNFVIYDKSLVTRPRYDVMRHMDNKNIALNIGRASQVTGNEKWDILICSKTIVDFNLFRLRR